MSTPTEVRMNKYKAANNGPLYTLGLATCVRIAVKGSYRNGSRGEGYDRFLAHIAEEKTADGSSYIGLQGFINTINRAQANQLEIDEIVIVVGDKSQDDDYNENDSDCVEEEKDQDKFNNAVILEIQKHVGKAVNVADHASAEDKSWELRIRANKEIVFKPDRGGNYESYEDWDARQSAS